MDFPAVTLAFGHPSLSRPGRGPALAAQIPARRCSAENRAWREPGAHPIRASSHPRLCSPSPGAPAPALSQHKRAWDEAQTPLALGGVRCFPSPLSHGIFHWRLFQFEGGGGEWQSPSSLSPGVPWSPSPVPQQIAALQLLSGRKNNGEKIKLQTEDNLRVMNFQKYFEKVALKNKKNTTKRMSPRKTWGFTSLEAKCILERKTFA